MVAAGTTAASWRDAGAAQPRTRSGQNLQADGRVGLGRARAEQKASGILAQPNLTRPIHPSFLNLFN